MSLKALADAVLAGNLVGNSEETGQGNLGNFRGQNEGKKFPEKTNYISNKITL